MIKSTVWEKTKGVCWYCGKAMNPIVDFTISHVIPEEETLKNYVPSCKRCSVIKKGMSLENFRDKMTYLSQARFTPEQSGFLASLKVKIPSPNKYVFEFEKKGITP